MKYPGFEIDTFKNDVTLIKLDRDVTFDNNDNINVICMNDEANTTPGTDVYAVGWGFTSKNSKVAADQLNQIKFPIQPYSNCGVHYIRDLQFCAGDQNLEKDTCNVTNNASIKNYLLNLKLNFVFYFYFFK
jgi:hypothetical protein